MEMNFSHCWDCPLGLGPAVSTALTAVAFLYAAVRLYRANTITVRFLGGCAAGIAFFLYAGLTHYIGWHGLAVTTRPDALPFRYAVLFLFGWLAVTALVVHAARSRRPTSASSGDASLSRP